MLYRNVIHLICLLYLISFSSGFSIDGHLQKSANRTLKLPPEPPRFDFRVEPLFPDIAFDLPVDIVSVPGDPNRLFVVEISGKIKVVSHLDGEPEVAVFMDLSDRIVREEEAGLLGLTFHPNHLLNGRFYVFYSTETTTRAGTGLHQKVSEFRVRPEEPNVGVKSVEIPLITQYDESPLHNGGDLEFGPDGYLYISVGDEGLGFDVLQNSQRIDKDYFSGILRIDVNNSKGSLKPNPHPATIGVYRIPPDNPFIGATEFNGLPVDPSQVRTEFYAVGLRNPWRMSFDSLTGDLYAVDTGQNQREEINRIVNGGNYGWSIQEGSIGGPFWNPDTADRKDLIDPLFEYDHSVGNGISGGLLYRGNPQSPLYGSFLFSDFFRGAIGAAKVQLEPVLNMTQLTWKPHIASFAIHPAEDTILMADTFGNQILKLVPDLVNESQTIPDKLSQTGAFSSLQDLVPETGIIPFDVNVPFWSDGAEKKRWFGMTDESNHFGFSAEEEWGIPLGSFWIKHFDLELEVGNPESRRRLETRFLVRHARGIYGLTYRWNEDQTDAELVPEEGMTEAIPILDGTEVRNQVWQYPARSQCLSCHSEKAGLVLGFNTLQLNKEIHSADGGRINQLQALSRAGYLDPVIHADADLPSVAAASDSDFSLDYRVRSYLSVNCSPCHRPGGSARGALDLRWNALFILSGLNDVLPLTGIGYHPEDRIVAPGSPDHSVLLHRISTLESARMPPLSSSVVDQSSVDLLTDWIRELQPVESFLDWYLRNFPEQSFTENSLNEDPDQDGSSNWVEFIVGTNPLNSEENWPLQMDRQQDRIRISFPYPKNRRIQVEWTDTFNTDQPWKALKEKDNRSFFPMDSFDATYEGIIPENENRFFRIRLFHP